MSFADHLHWLNGFGPQQAARFVPWQVAGQPVGLLRPELADWMRGLDGLFETQDGKLSLAVGDDFEQRSQALSRLSQSMLEAGWLDHLVDEPYPVCNGDRQRPLALVDRAVASHLGIRAFGQHLNGYVRRDDGLHMWVARRARDRRLFPGRLDNLVAGGLPWGVSLADNLAKECHEEAGMPAELAARAVAVGEIRYNALSPKGYKPDTLYCYDLELADDFEPVCTDGEVECFMLWPIEQVAEVVRDSEQFKPNCNLVIIDFLLRHGLLGPDAAHHDRLRQRLRPDFLL